MNMKCDLFAFLKGLPKILVCKNFWEEEKKIVGMRKYKEFCVFK